MSTNSPQKLYEKEFFYSFLIGALTIPVGFVWKEVIEAILEISFPSWSKLQKNLVIATLFTVILFSFIGYINRERSNIATQMHYIRNKFS